MTLPVLSQFLIWWFEHILAWFAVYLLFITDVALVYRWGTLYTGLFYRALLDLLTELDVIFEALFINQKLLQNALLVSLVKSFNILPAFVFEKFGRTILDILVVQFFIDLRGSLLRNRLEYNNVIQLCNLGFQIPFNPLNLTFSHYGNSLINTLNQR